MDWPLVVLWQDYSTWTTNADTICMQAYGITPGPVSRICAFYPDRKVESAYLRSRTE